jgi:hypothetical protein
MIQNTDRLSCQAAQNWTVSELKVMVRGVLFLSYLTERRITLGYATVQM